jgi:sodium/potassium-transporting ATPase subunit alpha
VKAKFSYPFGRRVVSNRYNFYGILAGACLGVFIVYTPPLHVVFGGSYHLLPLYWLIPFAFGILLLVWASIRVVLMRKSLENQRVKDISGLMMCTCRLLLYTTLALTSSLLYVLVPTMRTMSMRNREKA